MAVSKRKAAKPRVRRSPEDAKQAILDAAGRVFSRVSPDVAGLKEVAREAGVSHALITHYFGTYDALVEAALEHRFELLRADLLPILFKLGETNADAHAIIDAHFGAIQRATSDPAAIRLAIWAMLTGRAVAEDFFPSRVQGMKLIADAMATRSTAPREDLEFALVLSFVLASTLTLGSRAFAGALGRKPSPDVLAGFEQRAKRVIHSMLGTR